MSYFDVSEQSDRIVLAPVRVHQGDAARRKLRELGVSATEAVALAGAGSSREGFPL